LIFRVSYPRLYEDEIRSVAENSAKVDLAGRPSD
jgi:hypothetical protein